MRPEWNKKYTTMAVYSFLVLTGVAIFILAIIHFDDLKSAVSNCVNVTAPVWGGLIFAYLLNPLVSLFDGKLFAKIGRKKNKTKLRRGLSVFCTYFIVLLAFTAFFMLFIPELISNYHDLTEKYGSIEKINLAIEEIVSGNKFLSDNYHKIMEMLGIEDGGIVGKLLEWFSGIVPGLISALTAIASGVYNVILAIIFSVYVLCYRETMVSTARKLSTALLSKKIYNGFSKVLKTTDDNIGKYVRGKLFGSIMVGIVSYIAYMIFGFQFAPVLAVIAGVTNMIPFFGPFMGGVPAGIIVLIAQPEKLLLLILIILVLQQIDGNILDPMIVGNQVGLAPVWTMMATIVFGGFFGIPGMFLGVPIFATIYTLVKEKINSILHNRNLPVETSAYYNSPVAVGETPSSKEENSSREKIDEAGME